MKVLTLCVLGSTLFACTKEVSRSPVPETLSPKPVEVDPVQSRPDSAGVQRARSLGDSSVATLGADTVPPTPMNWSDSLDAMELAGIAASGGKVARKNFWDLRIQLLNGQTLVFKTDSAISWGYRYAGHLQQIHSHVVHRVPYEDTGNYLIVDDSTGDSTVVWAMPVPSPDGRRFVLTSLGEDEESDVGNISVWRMIGRTPEKEFSMEEGNWRSSDAVWRDAVTIDFTRNTSQDRDDPFTYIKTPARLTRTGTTWILSDSMRR
jgi:hypothetical protein